MAPPATRCPVAGLNQSPVPEADRTRYVSAVATMNPLIAVVDDEAPVRAMLQRALSMADYDVATYSSGEEFLEDVHDHRPACAILDLHLPGLSGLAVDRKLRAADLRIPFILITASDDDAIDASAASAGAVKVLHKPFSTDDLLAALQIALADSPPPG